MIRRQRETERQRETYRAIDRKRRRQTERETVTHIQETETETDTLGRATDAEDEDGVAVRAQLLCKQVLAGAMEESEISSSSPSPLNVCLMRLLPLRMPIILGTLPAQSGK